MADEQSAGEGERAGHHSPERPGQAESDDRSEYGGASNAGGFLRASAPGDRAASQGTAQSRPGRASWPSPPDAPVSPERTQSADREQGAGESRFSSWMSADPLSNLANVLTVVLALTAIGLSLWEGYQNREFFRLSVLPKLERVDATINGIGSPPGSDLGRMLSSGVVGASEDSVYSMIRGVRNDGLGPAIVRNFVVFRGGEKVYDARRSSQDYSFEEVRNDLRALPFRAGAYTSGFGAGETIRAGEEQPLIVALVPRRGDEWTPGIVEERVINRRSFVLCYCSVYGTDCSELHIGAAPPTATVCRF